MDELEKLRQDKMNNLMSPKVKIDVSDANFDNEVLEQSKKVPVVVDFWAPWCMPCLMLAPIMEKLAKEYNGKFILAKLNVDENMYNSQRFGISGIPAVKMFKDGNVVDEFVGALPEPSVREWLDKNL
ncbi:thioredoxin [Candidatus Woesearchaeota archaeon]|nr:MAG: thioredoxin [Candidatus Woesearchaeota archaeon]